MCAYNFWKVWQPLYYTLNLVQAKQLTFFKLFNIDRLDKQEQGRSETCGADQHPSERPELPVEEEEVRVRESRAGVEGAQQQVPPGHARAQQKDEAGHEEKKGRRVSRRKSQQEAESGRRKR